MNRLKGFDLLALGFMTFALFLGAGNIIFPPSAGMAAGEFIWRAALGFLLTGVGLPLLTVVALARVGGGWIDSPHLWANSPVRCWLSRCTWRSVRCSPHRAPQSFRSRWVSRRSVATRMPLFIYTLVFFAAMLFLVLNPGQLVNRIGKFITPVLLAALLVLGGAAIFAPAGEVGAVNESYRGAPLIKGFLEGYLTMDTLGALVFGIVIATAIRDRGVTEPALVTRYSMIAGVIAAIGLSLVYLALFYLGATSQGIAGGAENGVQILTTYVQHTFGTPGSLLLAVVITLACLTTAVADHRLWRVLQRAAAGLLSQCGDRVRAVQPAGGEPGLTQLISVFVPVLVGLYPLAIVLVALSLLDRFWLSSSRVFVPVMAVTLVFGVVDGLAAAGLGSWVPALFTQLPLADQSMGWLVPVLVMLVLAVVTDRLLGRAERVQHRA